MFFWKFGGGGVKWQDYPNFTFKKILPLMQILRSRFALATALSPFQIFLRAPMSKTNSEKLDL